MSCLLVGLVLFSWMLVNAQSGPDPSLFGQWTTLIQTCRSFPSMPICCPQGK